MVFHRSNEELQMMRASYKTFLVAGSLIASSPVCAQTASSILPQRLPLLALITQGGNLASVLDTLNGGFFNQNNTLVGSPGGTKTDQIGGGGWLRPTGGTFNTSVSGTLTVPGAGSALIPLKASSDYVGVQAGGDIARYDFGASGYNVNVGVMGGQVSVQSRGLATGGLSNGNADFDIPFVGVYAAVGGHNFSGDILFREDFLNVTIPDLDRSATLTASTFATSASYRFDLPEAFFLVPGAGISISTLEGKTFAVPQTTVTDVGLTRFGSVDSDLGRGSITIGRNFTFDRLTLSPTIAGSVFREFAGSTKITYTDLNSASSSFAGLTSTGIVTRVGTFEQFSAGINASVAGTGLASFVKGDIRTGDRVDGYSVSGGIRYSF